MLTARRAFPGEDITDTIVSVVSKEPDWSALPTQTPSAIRRVLARCLKKDAKARMRDIGEARLEIEDALTSPADGAADVPNPHSSGKLQIWTVPLEDQGGQLKAGTPEPFLKSTFSDQAPFFSPDGRWLAYTSDESGRNEVYAREFLQPSAGQGGPSTSLRAGKWQVSNMAAQVRAGRAADTSWCTNPETNFADELRRPVPLGK